MPIPAILQALLGAAQTAGAAVGSGMAAAGNAAAGVLPSVGNTLSGILPGGAQAGISSMFSGPGAMGGFTPGLGGGQGTLVSGGFTPAAGPMSVAPGTTAFSGLGSGGMAQTSFVEGLKSLAPGVSDIFGAVKDIGKGVKHGDLDAVSKGVKRLPAGDASGIPQAPLDDSDMQVRGLPARKRYVSGPMQLYGRRPIV